MNEYRFRRYDNKDDMNEFKSYLIGIVGENWLKHLSNEELKYFCKFAHEAGIYALSKNDERIACGNIGDLLRGFVTGLRLGKHGLENFNGTTW